MSFNLYDYSEGMHTAWISLIKSLNWVEQGKDCKINRQETSHPFSLIQ